jgi:hypothetical protein
MVKEIVSNENIMKMAGQAVLILVTIVISMTGFWVMIGRDLTTRSEVESMVNSRLSVEIKSLEFKMDTYNRQENISREVLQKNTDAIQGLQVQMATLNTTLEHIMKDNRNERDR